jgi:hypothetical protein
MRVPDVHSRAMDSTHIKVGQDPYPHHLMLGIRRASLDRRLFKTRFTYVYLRTWKRAGSPTTYELQVMDHAITARTNYARASANSVSSITSVLSCLLLKSLIFLNLNPEFFELP